MADPTDGAQQAASKLAQLLGETIVSHAPWTADISEAAKWEHTNKWLDGIEAHSSELIGPLIQKLLDASDPPDEIRALMQRAITPGAAFDSVLVQVFMYSVIGNIVTVLLTPMLQQGANNAGTQATELGFVKPVDLATAATAAARGLNLGAAPTVPVPQWAYDQAAQQGVSKQHMDLAASIVGLPPALQELFELWRRGVIDIDAVKTGLREGDFRDDWIDRVVNLAHTWATPLDFVRAAVQEQLTYADAAEWATKTGLDTTTSVPVKTGGGEQTPDMFGLLYAISGRPPGPQELAAMAHRGIIPWEGVGAGETTFQQGIAESDVKTKWTDKLRALSTYVPPPAEIGALLERGAITSEDAVKLWEQRGVPTALANGYRFIAQQQHVGQDKLLARSDILTGLFDGLFSETQAKEMLALLGLTGQVADDLISITQFRRNIKAINTVVTRVANVYMSYRMTATDAKRALVGAGVDPAQADELLHTWEQFRIQPVRLPTVMQIGYAVRNQTLTIEQAMTEMERLGYQPRDAAIALQEGAKIKISPLPPEGTSIADVGPEV